MVFGGILALVLAGIAYIVHGFQQRKLKAMLMAETLSCGELGELAQAAADAVEAGSFRHACEVVGTVEAGEQGLLKAPDSGREVVWHRTMVIERYWELEKDSQGNERQVEKTRTVAAHVSEQPFAVRDATGTIVVEPKGASVDAAPMLADRFEQDT